MTRAHVVTNSTRSGWAMFCDNCSHRSEERPRQGDLPLEEFAAAGWFIAEKWGDLCPACVTKAGGVTHVIGLTLGKPHKVMSTATGDIGAATPVVVAKALGFTALGLALNYATRDMAVTSAFALVTSGLALAYLTTVAWGHARRAGRVEGYVVGGPDGWVEVRPESETGWMWHCPTGCGTAVLYDYDADAVEICGPCQQAIADELERDLGGAA